MIIEQRQRCRRELRPRANLYPNRAKTSDDALHNLVLTPQLLSQRHSQQPRPSQI